MLQFLSKIVMPFLPVVKPWFCVWFQGFQQILFLGASSFEMCFSIWLPNISVIHYMGPNQKHTSVLFILIHVLSTSLLLSSVLLLLVMQMMCILWLRLYAESRWQEVVTNYQPSHQPTKSQRTNISNILKFLSNVLWHISIRFCRFQLPVVIAVGMDSGALDWLEFQPLKVG